MITIFLHNQRQYDEMQYNIKNGAKKGKIARKKTRREKDVAKKKDLIKSKQTCHLYSHTHRLNPAECTNNNNNSKQNSYY